MFMDQIGLQKAFAKRENRFLLLDKGVSLAGFSQEDALLEIGCAGGEAAVHLYENGWKKITAVDLDEHMLKQARKAAPGCRFLCADARALPVENESFDGLFSEAAFSVMPEKKPAAAEYARVLRHGGRFLLNDFCLRSDSDVLQREGLGIPMLEGVQTMDVYEALFTAEGLSCLYRREEYLTLLQIGDSLRRGFGVSPRELGGYIAEACGDEVGAVSFFTQTEISYCQMIFKKTG